MPQWSALPETDGTKGRGAVALGQICTVLLFVAMALALAITVLSVFYTFVAFPMTDDLGRTAFIRTHTIWSAVSQEYQLIDGRWFSLLVQYLCYAGDRTWQRYFLMLAIPHLLVLLGLCCLAALICRRSLASPAMLGIGVAAYAYLWVSLPTGENLYWFPSVLGYWLPEALGLITLFVLTRFTGLWSRVFVLVMALILPVMHEVCGGWIAGAFGMITLIRLLNRDQGARFTAWATLISLASMATEVLAPGVRLRAQSTPHMPISDALFHGYQQYGIMLKHWPSLAAVLLLVMLAAARLNQLPRWYAQAPHLIKACLAVASVPFAILLLDAIAYSLGGGVPPRLYDGVYVLVVMAFALLAALIGLDLGRLKRVQRLSDSLARPALLGAGTIAVLITVLALPRTHAAFYEAGISMRNRVVAEQRDALLRKAQLTGETDVELNQSLLPETILPTEFEYTADPSWYANQDANAYYRLHSLKVLPERR